VHVLDPGNRAVRVDFPLFAFIPIAIRPVEARSVAGSLELQAETVRHKESPVELARILKEKASRVVRSPDLDGSSLVAAGSESH
jgi:hypothetical protein